MATIRDVARAAGVSIATVSRALNGSDRVTDATRRRVCSAATELDYWPHGAAQALQSRRTQVLGVLLPELHGEFFSEIIRGIDDTARADHHQVLLSSSHADTDAVLSAARSMRGRIDGLIIMAPERGSIDPIGRITRRFSVVLLNPSTRVDGCSTVGISNVEGSLAVVQHLIQLGHRDIAVITGPSGNVDAHDRLRGYRLALKEAGIAPRPELEIKGDFTQSSGYRGSAMLVSLAPRPTAVFASNDAMAIGCLSGLAAQDVSVPADMAVAGFDDISMSRYSAPPLTTAHVDAYKMGERAVRLLIGAMKNSERKPRHDVLPAPLVVRNSCGGRPLRKLFVSPED